jgi:hypothetical protein
MSSGLVPLSVFISQNQARKLVKGKPVQLSHSALSQGHNVKMMVHPSTHKRVQKALRNNKGTRIILSQSEIDGSGIFDFLKNAASWVKKNIIDTDLYQKNVRPIARELVKTGVSLIPGPQLARDVATKGTEYLSEKTGAFGMRGRGRPSGLKSDRSDFLNPNHPTFDSKPPTRPPGLAGS